MLYNLLLTFYIQKKLLPPPYKAYGNSTCLDTESPSFKTPLVHFHNYSYTKLSCVEECLANKLIQTCGCRIFFGAGTTISISLFSFNICLLTGVASTTISVSLFSFNLCLLIGFPSTTISVSLFSFNLCLLIGVPYTTISVSLFSF